MHLVDVRTREQLEAFWTVEAASYAADFLALPADPVEELAPLLDGQDHAGERARLFLALVGDLPLATLTLTLPVLDNLSTAHLDGHVHPGHRRHGLGRQLLAAGLAEVQAAGRRRVFVSASAPLVGGDGAAGPLLRAVGGRPALEEHRRLLDLQTHPPGPATTPPPAYRIVRWEDHCPPDLVDGVAYLMGRMSTDAPLGTMDYEPERWDAVRYRDKEQHGLARNRRRIAAAVVEQNTGAVAGITDIGVNRSRPEVAYQWDTIVDPAHRGRGLGRVLKQVNAAALIDAVPGVRWVNTWNAPENTHMVRVNDRLGFLPVERWLEWQLDL